MSRDGDSILRSCDVKSSDEDSGRCGSLWADVLLSDRQLESNAWVLCLLAAREQCAAHTSVRTTGGRGGHAYAGMSAFGIPAGGGGSTRRPRHTVDAVQGDRSNVLNPI